MDFILDFDFSFLDRVPTFYSRSSVSAEDILSFVANAISDCFFYFYYLIQGSGFWGMFTACIFIVSVFRLVIYPIVGGRSIQMGADSAGLRGVGRSLKARYKRIPVTD